MFGQPKDLVGRRFQVNGQDRPIGNFEGQVGKIISYKENLSSPNVEMEFDFGYGPVYYWLHPMELTYPE